MIELGETTNIYYCVYENGILAMEFHNKRGLEDYIKRHADKLSSYLIVESIITTSNKDVTSNLKPSAEQHIEYYITNESGWDLLTLKSKEEAILYLKLFKILHPKKTFKVIERRRSIINIYLDPIVEVKL